MIRALVNWRSWVQLVFAANVVCTSHGEAMVSCMKGQGVLELDVHCSLKS